MPIEKTYNPSAIEEKFYSLWEKSGAFACNPNSSAKPYCIMMPPPNVTGSLHMGHGLTFTLQDILIRFKRMQGFDVLWQPGTDHAGIATQMVVERQLEKKGLTRQALGREAFLKKVWEWKEESGGTITRQLRRLGASPDWSRERFTMDEGLSRAVTKVFVSLYREGLIYKDKRLVNWDPKLLTAISDLEVEQKEIKGNLWYFRYPIENSEEFIVVATTRPETMLGDTAVAVHPFNEKLKHLIGKNVILPLANRLIPIIGDEYADPEKGTGAVKITPAHDFNDFEVGRRHKLPMINIFDKNACLNEEAPQKYRGLDRFKAREAIVKDMEELGLLEKVMPHVHTIPHGDRSGVPIEPWLSEQWYCDAGKLAVEAIKAVEDGRTVFVPKQWENTYFAWMRNIEPWCISRQLWWGHQIPAWYGPDNKIFVAETEEDALAEAERFYDMKVRLKRDEDVLDTWFSSALWPFSTLDWPENTPELKRYYPTDVLVTGFDIIFFWVARMMMMGLHFLKDVPFRTVYIHALVRDEKGQKMSKTKGNVMDPLEMIEKYGCDALRFTLANLSTPGRDIKLSAARIEGNRNFATKLWNVARFCQMNNCSWRPDFDPAKVKLTINRWIVGETKLAVEKVTSLLEQYRFDLATHAIYEFVWNTFCDWYLEFTKPLFAEKDETAKTETRAVTAWVLSKILKLLHPFMPYITEEIWSQLIPNGKLLITESWPLMPDSLLHEKAQDEVNWVISLISSVRSVRAELNVPAAAQIPLQIKDASEQNLVRLSLYKPMIQKLARISSIMQTNEILPGSAQTPFGEAVLVLPLAEVIDLDKERARLARESEKWANEIRKLEAKLANQDFIRHAPEEVIEEHRERKTAAEEMLEKIKNAQRTLVS